MVHVKNMKSLLKVIEQYDGKMFEDEDLLKEAKEEGKEKGEDLTLEECKQYAKNKCLAIEILKSSKHKQVIEEVRTQYVYKNNVYPSDAAEAFELLEHYAKKGRKNTKASKAVNNSPDKTEDDMVQGAQFAQESKGRGADEKGEVKCYITAVMLDTMCK